MRDFYRKKPQKIRKIQETQIELKISNKKADAEIERKKEEQRKAKNVEMSKKGMIAQISKNFSSALNIMPNNDGSRHTIGSQFLDKSRGKSNKSLTVL